MELVSAEAEEAGLDHPGQWLPGLVRLHRGRIFLLANQWTYF